MFWKRERKIVHGNLGPLLIPTIPAKKEFNTMYELLQEAERFDSKNEKEVCNDLLNSLIKQIETFKNK